MTDIMIVYMIIHDLKYCNRHNKEDSPGLIPGDLLFFVFSQSFGCIKQSFIKRTAILLTSI